MPFPFKLPSWLMPAALGLLLAALAVLGTLYSSARETIAAQKTQVAALKADLARNEATFKVIVAATEKQSAAVKRLAEIAETNRRRYAAAFAAANERAKDHDKRAEDLLALPAPVADELGQCRAARALILQETLQ